MNHHSHPTPRVDIVLTSIIRNEEKTICRLLDSVVGFANFIVLCDTGSTDNTLSVIQEWSTRHPQMIMYIFQDEWKHFGHNRTLSMIHARSVIPENRHAFTFMLFLDADMKFQWESELSIESWKSTYLLHCPVWYLYQKNFEIEYHNIRMVRMDIPSHCVGPTHEFYQVYVSHDDVNALFQSLPKQDQTSIINCVNGLLDKRIWIDDIGDGGCKHDKFERDIRLLETYLKTERPNDARTLFYLANSYKNSRQFEKAIKTYTERIEVQGWVEEIYLSWVYKGECFFDLDKPMDGMTCFHQAIQVLPQRIEAWYRLMKAYRLQKWYHEAYLLCRHAQTLPTSFENSQIPLFLERHIYLYLLDQEMSICAYYVGDFERGKQSCQHLLSFPNLPREIYALAESNSRFYVSQTTS